MIIIYVFLGQYSRFCLYIFAYFLGGLFLGWVHIYRQICFVFLTMVCLDRDKYCMQRKWFFALVLMVFVPVIFLGIISSLLSLLPTLFALEVFDHVVGGNNVELIPILVVGGILGLLLMSILDVTRGVVWHRSALWLEAWAFPRIIQHVMRLRRTDGVMQDLAAIRSFASLSSLPIAFDFLLIPFFMGVLGVIHPYFLYIALIGLFLLILCTLISGVLTDRLSEQMSDKYNVIRDAVVWVARYTGPVEGIKRQVADVMEESYEASALQRRVYDRVAVFAAFSRFIRASVQFLCTGVGAALVITHEIGIGAMIGASLLVMRSLAPVEALLAVLKPVSRAIAAWRRLLVDVSVGDGDEVKVLMDDRGDLMIEDGTVFTWSDLLMPIGGSDTLSASVGALTLLIGVTGSGKTLILEQCAGIRLNALCSVNNQPASLAGDARGVLFVPENGFDGSVVSDAFPVGFTWDSLLSVSQSYGILHIDRYVSPRLWNQSWSAMSLGQRKLLSLLVVLADPSPMMLLDAPLLGMDKVLAEQCAEAIGSLKYIGVGVVCTGMDSLFLPWIDKMYVLDGKSITLVDANALEGY